MDIKRTRTSKQKRDRIEMGTAEEKKISGGHFAMNETEEMYQHLILCISKSPLRT